MTKDELVEALADKEHTSWGSWMIWLFNVSRANPDGTYTISKDDVDRWKGQAHTSYADLSEKEKTSDREEVYKIIPIIEEHVQDRIHNEPKIDVTENGHTILLLRAAGHLARLVRDKQGSNDTYRILVSILDGLLEDVDPENGG